MLLRSRRTYSPLRSTNDNDIRIKIVLSVNLCVHSHGWRANGTDCSSYPCASRLKEPAVLRFVPGAGHGQCGGQIAYVFIPHRGGACGRLFDRPDCMNQNALPCGMPQRHQPDCGRDLPFDEDPHQALQGHHGRNAPMARRHDKDRGKAQLPVVGIFGSGHIEVGQQTQQRLPETPVLKLKLTAFAACRQPRIGCQKALVIACLLYTSPSPRD